MIVKTGENQTISGVEAKEKLKKEGIVTTEKKVRLVVEPYMSVEVKGVTEKRGVNVITFEITVLYNVKPQQPERMRPCRKKEPVEIPF